MAGSSTAGLPSRLGMVVLSARDLPALRRFYRGLGWTEQAGASDALAFFPLGDVTLALFPHATGSEEPGGTMPVDRSGMTLVIRLEGREAVDASFTRAVEVGALPVSGPQDQSFGGRSAVLADPEGNRWELLWIPSGDG